MAAFLKSYPKLTTYSLWSRTPFMRLTIPFIIGIIIENYFTIHICLLGFSFICFAVALFVFICLPLNFHFKTVSLQGLIICLLISSTAAIITYYKDIKHNKYWFGNYIRENQQTIVNITSSPEEKSGSYKVEGDVIGIFNSNHFFNTTGKLIIYFEKDKISEALKYGDKILLEKHPELIRNTGNPGSFNYRQYAAFQQIYYSVYLKNFEWKLLYNNKPTSLIQPLIIKIRNRILETFRHTLKDQKIFSVAEALLMGYKTDLDKETISEYNDAGATTIIAASGIHLGLIFIVLIWLVNRLPFLGDAHIFKTIIILFSICVIAILTGATASILRWSLIICFITLAEAIGKRNNRFNFLAASAFILLCYNPFYLWDIGFQLSYLAILGILLFNTKINSIIRFESKWKSKVWQLISINLSVQVLTFPLAIYYFHQYSNLFLITGLLFVPFSSIILFAEILLLLIYKVKLIGLAVSQSVFFLINFMNKTISLFSNIPFATIHNINLTFLQLLLLYAVLLSFTVCLYFRKRSFLYIGLSSLFIFSIFYFSIEFRVLKQHKIIVYNINHHSSIDMLNGKHCNYAGDADVLNDSKLFTNNIQPARILFHINQTDKIPSNNTTGIYKYNNKKVLIIDDSSSINYIKPQHIDLIILSKKAFDSITKLYDKYSCQNFVFDSSNPLWKIEEWKKECELLHLRFHSTSESGAFIMDL